MIDILHEYRLNADIYLDGMCQKAARVYLQYPQYVKNSKFLAKSLRKVHWVKNLSMRKKALKTPLFQVHQGFFLREKMQVSKNTPAA